MASGPSPAVLAARQRRQAASGGDAVKFEWFIDNVMDTLNLSLKQKTQIATEYVKSKVIKNISQPVTKMKGKVTNRSTSGEFPKADTTQLMKTIAMEVKQISKDVYEGYVGTPLDYGLILEVSERLDRSYLRRTLQEELRLIKKIFSEPIS